MYTLLHDWLARLAAWSRGETPSTAGSSRPDSVDDGVYRAVAIEPVGECCHAAREWSFARFLTTQAPRLPLADCSTPGACRCRYQKFDDRRAGTDRRDAFEPIAHEDRRRRIDRRATTVVEF